MTLDAPTFRLAQLSDIHLGPLPAFGPGHWNVKRALGYVNWQRKRKALHRPEVLAAITADLATQTVDHVAVTGDLVNIGLPAEHEAAARWLTTLGSADSISVIPGNHDIYTRLWRDHGIARWSAYMASDSYGAALRVAAGVPPDMPFPSVRRLGPLALIGLNSALPTPPGIAAGRIGRRQRQALASILAATGVDGLCRVLMLHHPLAEGPGQHLRGLSDAPAVKAIIAEAGSELVMHGHNHRDEVNAVARRQQGAQPVPVIGAASASTAFIHHDEPLARYNIYEFTRTNDAWTIQLTVRGLAAPNGPVVELARRAVRPATHANS